MFVPTLPSISQKDIFRVKNEHMDFYKLRYASWQSGLHIQRDNGRFFVRKLHHENNFSVTMYLNVESFIRFLFTLNHPNVRLSAVKT